MNKQISEKKELQTPPTETFLGFWLTMASLLGDGRLCIRAGANSIDHFFAPNSDHREFFRDVIVTTYFECHCTCLDDAIDVNKVLDVMGEAAFDLQSRNQDDLLDIELLEEIAFHIQNHYPASLVMPTSMLAEQHHKNKKRGFGGVVSMRDTLIRKANARF